MRAAARTYVFGAMRQHVTSSKVIATRKPRASEQAAARSHTLLLAIAGWSSTRRNPTSMSQPSGGPLGASSRRVRQESRVLRRHTRQAQQRRNAIIERGLYFSALPILLMLIMAQRSWNERSDIEAYLALMPAAPPMLDEKDSDISRRHSKAVASKEVSKHKASDEKRIKSTEKRKTDEAKHKDSTIIAPPKGEDAKIERDAKKVSPNTKAKSKPKGKAVDSKQVNAAHKADKKAKHEPKDNEIKDKATQMGGSNHTGREGLADKLLANIDRQFSLSSYNASLTEGAMPNCLDPKGPQPVVLMSLGRSGSSSTWQVLGSLTGQETKSVEYTGSSRSASIRFFEKIGPNDNGMWVLKYMCFMQQLFPKVSEGVVGFKWKPNRSILSMDASVNGLKLLGKLKNPSIKVVRSRRNLLDVLISRYKHKRSTANVPAHCRVGDKACLEKHQLGVELPAYKLLSLLKTLTKEENDVDKRLKEYGVPRISASFDKLYYSDDASEWQKILQFLSPNAAKRIGSISDVRKAMQHQATSHPSHKMTIRNFDEVRNAINGTKFEKLLRP